jgi:hypothetical protein
MPLQVLGTAQCLPIPRVLRGTLCIYSVQFAADDGDDDDDGDHHHHHHHHHISDPA